MAFSTELKLGKSYKKYISGWLLWFLVHLQVHLMFKKYICFTISSFN